MTVLWLNVRRMAWIIRVTLAHLTAHLLGPRVRRWPFLARRLRQPGLPWPERLRALLEDLGGTFIKFGQMLALQPDIVSFEVCDALSNLLDRVAPFPYEAVERTFREELGRTPAEVFDSFDPEPIATASIGQVHVAYLDGRKLAVKVQRPGVDVQFAGDIRLMGSMLWLIRHLRLRAFYWAVEPLTEFIAWTAEELDYRTEARYMEQLRANCQENPVERVPEFLGSCLSRRTLVTEFFDGVTLLGYLRAREAGDQMTLRRLELSGLEPNQFARNIIDNFLGDAFRHGLFHADLHPANLMVLPGNVVGYVDFGITGVLSQYSRRQLVGLTLAYTRGDIEAMCQAFFKVAVTDPGSDPEGFRAGMERLAGSWYDLEGPERKLKKNFTLVMLDMLKLSRSARVWPEQDVVKYIRSAIAIDGLITRFAPGFEVGQYLEQVCGHHLRLQGLQKSLGRDHLLDWSVAGARLLRDGPLRGEALLDRLLSGSMPIRADVVEGGDGGSRDLRRRAVRLSVFLAGTGLLIGLTPGHLELGVNPLSAAVLLFASALAMLVDTVRRLA